MGSDETDAVGTADVRLPVYAEASKTDFVAAASQQSVPLCASSQLQAAASQTDADAVLSPERCMDLLRTLTAKSAMLAGKNAKLREDRDRLQAREISDQRSFETCSLNPALPWFLSMSLRHRLNGHAMLCACCMHGLVGRVGNT